jgi:predicted DNA-binding protein (MmcQ/YjbR family)
MDLSLKISMGVTHYYHISHFPSFDVKLITFHLSLITYHLSLSTYHLKMDIESLRIYCLSKKAATEDTPFGPDTLVFRVMGKIYGLVSLDILECRINLKCDPNFAIELRENHPDHIISGYHMNKKHWNTVYCERGIDDKLIRELVDHSYDLIVQSLPKIARQELEAL